MMLTVPQQLQMMLLVPQLQMMLLLMVPLTTMPWHSPSWVPSSQSSPPATPILLLGAPNR